MAKSLPQQRTRGFCCPACGERDMLAAHDHSVPIPGWASYRCVNYDCRHEWDGRAEMYEGQMDPAAINRADDCPKCGTESDDVMDWTPEYYGRVLTGEAA